jgi:hypothetical protein
MPVANPAPEDITPTTTLAPEGTPSSSATRTAIAFPAITLSHKPCSILYGKAVLDRLRRMS